MSKRGKLPLNDPRWLPLLEALEYCRLRIGSEFFASLELQQEFAAGRIRTAARYLDQRTQPPTSKVALLTRASWKGRTLIWMRKGLLPNSFKKGLHHSIIYVWRPDLEKRWPPPPPRDHATDAAPASQPGAAHAAQGSVGTAPPQRRRGPATTHDWHSIDGEIARRCIDPKTGRVKVPKKK